MKTTLTEKLKLKLKKRNPWVVLVITKGVKRHKNKKKSKPKHKNYTED